MKIELDLSKDFEQMCRGAIKATVSYLKNNPSIKSMIIGLSGGIDSCVTAAIASEAGKELNIPLLGFSLPVMSNKYHETERAELAGKAFCDTFEMNTFLGEPVRNLIKLTDSNLWKSLASSNASFDDKVRLGNIKARMRMIFLFDQARKHNGMVLSTDNFTELMLGFWTLHGDVGNFGIIQNLWKTEVYGLSEWMAKSLYADDIGKMATLMAAVTAVPTDGLGITDSDLDQLLPNFNGSGREGYFEIDKILIEFLGFKVNKDHPVVQRHLATEFKRKDPYNVTRERLFWRYA